MFKGIGKFARKGIKAIGNAGKELAGKKIDEHDRVYGGMKGQFEAAKNTLEQLRQVRQDVVDNPGLSDMERRQMLANVDRGISDAQTAVDFATRGGDNERISGDRTGEADKQRAQQLLADAQASLAIAADDAQVSRATAGASDLTMVKMPPPPLDLEVDLSGVEGTQSSSGATGASGTPGSAPASGSTAGESSGLGAVEFGGKSVDEMMEMMRSDPQGLMNHLSDMPLEEKQTAMQSVMQRMQEINQMFSMISNMQKSAHDTAKAVINNMRV